MFTVTIPGAHGLTTTLSFDTASDAALAAQIASNIAHHTEVAADSAFGSPPPLGGLRGFWTQSTSGVTVRPKGYDVVVVSARDALIVGSGDANENVLAGTGNLAFSAKSGSGTIITGNGTDLINIAASDTGNWNIHTGGGTDAIVDSGKGHDTISTGSGHNAIVLGAGQYSVTSVGDDVIVQGAGAVTLNASGSTSKSSELVYGGAGNLDFIGGLGSATVFGGDGSVSVQGGSGPLYVTGGADGKNLLIAGSGLATLFGGGNGDTLIAAGSAAQQLHAASGNVTLLGGSATGADTFYGGAGKDQITGGQGTDTYVGGSGQATVNAVGSSNVFRFIHGEAGGTMQINDLTNASQVHIVLTGYASNEAAKAVADQISGAHSVMVTLSDRTQITFENITHLTTSNFA
jgi:Ca2+-binding RTX toxin-like protein